MTAPVPHSQPGIAQVWHGIKTAPEHEEVWTKIHDDDGERNVAKLTRHGGLWYTHPTNGMYVYYTPTHWSRP